jgi:hypothetical protein
VTALPSVAAREVRCWPAIRSRERSERLAKDGAASEASDWRIGLPTVAANEVSVWRIGLPTVAANEVTRLAEVGGEAGIRTLDTAFRPYNGLANRRLQPLGHLTVLVQVYRTQALTRTISMTHEARRPAFELSPSAVKCNEASGLSRRCVPRLGHRRLGTVPGTVRAFSTQPVQNAEGKRWKAAVSLTVAFSTEQWVKAMDTGIRNGIACECHWIVGASGLRPLGLLLSERR